MKPKLERYLKHRRLNYKFFDADNDLGVSFTVCGYTCNMGIEPGDTFDTVHNAIDELIAKIRCYHDVFI